MESNIVFRFYIKAKDLPKNVENRCFEQNFWTRQPVEHCHRTEYKDLKSKFLKNEKNLFDPSPFNIDVFIL